ncbi:MAG TPA: type II secretion system F family protein [Nitrospira sp.]
MLTGLIALGIFGTILLLLYAVTAAYRVLVPRGTDRAVERVQRWAKPESAENLDILRKDSLSDLAWLDDLLKTVQRLQPLRVLHRQADCPVPLGVFALAVPMLGLLGLMTALWFQQTWVVALVAGGLLAAIPPGILHWLKARRLGQLERQLPEALELVSRAMRAGHAFSVGLKIVGDESADPIRGEFQRVYDEVSMGVSLPQALANLNDRVDLIDVKFFVTSVMVQRETGGNLAEIIDSLASLIRRRFELQLKVRALSAEARFSAIILFGLPLVVALALYKMNPEYLGLLVTDPMGQRMTSVGVVLMLMGAVMMKRMVNIRV